MEMEDHNHNLNLHHHNQYNIDLRHFISSSSSASTTTNNNRPSPSQHFPPPPPPPPLSVDLFSRNHHHHQLPPHHYDMMMFMPRSSSGGFNEFHSDSTQSTCIPPSPAPPPPPTTMTMNTALLTSGSGSGHSTSNTLSAAVGCSTPTLCGLDGDAGSFGGDGGTGRWPRQETLTLLEIRSRLDLKFKEANQKGPLWDEVSRIMSEEHGYQRSGKKCREKFENLYKYYKKTKEGKAGRQDGKHYRFFRQLEALYGDTTSNNVNCSIPESQFLGSTVGRFHTGSISTSINVQGNQEQNFHNSSSHHHKVCDSLSLSNNSSEFDTCSSEDNDHDLSTATLLENDSSEKIRRKRRDGKSWKSKIKDFIDSQMRKLIERQETWLEKLTKTLEEKEQERVLREEEWRTQEAARVEKEHRFWANERAWIEARDAAMMDTLRKLTGKEGEITHLNHQIDNNNNNWEELEVSRLMQLRNSLEPRFQQSGSIEEEEELWREIARKMGTLGYDQKKNPLMCKEKWDSISNYNRKMMILSNKKRKENNNSNSSYFYYEQQGQSTTSNSTNNHHQNESCFPFLMSDGGSGGGENLWENYGLKLSKGGDQHDDDHHQDHDHHDGETT